MKRELKTRKGIANIASSLQYKLKDEPQVAQKLFKVPVGECKRKPNEEVLISYDCRVDGIFSLLSTWTDVVNKLRIVDEKSKTVEWVGGPITEDEITTLVNFARERKAISKKKSTEKKEKKVEEKLEENKELIDDLDKLQKSIFSNMKEQRPENISYIEILLEKILKELTDIKKEVFKNNTQLF